jgi:hypothetical protein
MVYMQLEGHEVLGIMKCPHCDGVYFAITLDENRRVHKLMVHSVSQAYGIFESCTVLASRIVPIEYYDALVTEIASSSMPMCRPVRQERKIARMHKRARILRCVSDYMEEVITSFNRERDPRSVH